MNSTFTPMDREDSYASDGKGPGRHARPAASSSSPRPSRARRYLIGAGATVVAGAAVVAGLMATSSHPSTVTHPGDQHAATVQTGGAGTHTANPAVPSRPDANPAVPSRPNANPAVPSQPGAQTANPAVPATPGAAS